MPEEIIQEIIERIQEQEPEIVQEINCSSEPELPEHPMFMKENAMSANTFHVQDQNNFDFASEMGVQQMKG